MILHCHLLSLLWVSYFCWVWIFFVGYSMEVNAKPTCCEPPATMGRFVWICQKRDRALQCEIPCWFGWLFVFLTCEVKGLHNLIYRITMEWFPGSTFGCMQVYHGMLHINRANHEQLTYSIEKKHFEISSVYSMVVAIGWLYVTYDPL